MSDSTVLEFVKLFGGLSGFCSAAALIYDRFTKHYPVAFIEAQPLIEGSAHIAPFLCLKNVSERPILISWKDGDLGRFRVAKDQTLKGVIRTMFNGETTIALSPQGEAILPLLRPGTYEDIDPENVIEFVATWQLAQPIIWRSPRSLKVQIRKRDLEALTEGYIESRRGSRQ